MGAYLETELTMNLFSGCFPFSRVSLCRPGSPGTHSVDQASLKLTETHLPLHLGAEIKCMCSHSLALSFLLKDGVGLTYGLGSFD